VTKLIFSRLARSSKFVSCLVQSAQGSPGAKARFTTLSPLASRPSILASAVILKNPAASPPLHLGDGLVKSFVAFVFRTAALREIAWMAMQVESWMMLQKIDAFR
jgi:hypothetical protein